jgi:hypothetical protein
MSEIAVAITTEIEPLSPKRPKRGVHRKKGVARPYRRVPEDVLAVRIDRLTERLERVRKQHESTRTLLTKYAHERHYREKDAIAKSAADILSAPPPLEIPNLPAP